MPNLPTQVPTPNTSPTSSELLYLVSDPYGTPADDAATAANIVTKAHGLSDGIIKVSSGVMVDATSGTDYVTGSSTNTFTNKTYDTAGTGNVLKINGTGISAITGTGSVVLATSPTISAPTISSHPTVEGVTSTGATGTGKFVFDGSPTLTTPNLGTPSAINLSNATSPPTWNQNTTGTAANLSGTPALPNGTTATTQSPLDSSTKLATTAYTDSAVTAGIQGLSIKDSVVAATTGSETFTILSGNVTVISGTTLDGQSPSNGDRILIKDAPAATGTGSAGSTQPGNGIYTVTSNVTNLTVSRAADMSGSNAPQGAFTFVEGGTANVSSGWVVSVPNTDGSFTYGTNNIKWTQFSGAGEVTAGTGLAKSGNTLSIENSGVLLPAHGGTGVNNSKNLTVSNSLTLAGTDSTTMTFPSTSATIARTDAANTFTGHQTIEGVTSTGATGTGNLVFATSPSLTGVTMSATTLATDTSTGLTIGTATNQKLGFFNATPVAQQAAATDLGTALSNLGLRVSGSAYPITTSGTVALTGAVSTNNLTYNIDTVSVSSNAGTCSASYYESNFTNSSASAMTITIATSGAVDGQRKLVRIYDATASAKGITWTNTENSANTTAPSTSAGSTTIPLTVGFIFNGVTSLWTCVAFS